MITARELEIDAANREECVTAWLVPCEFCWDYFPEEELTERPRKHPMVFGKMACSECNEAIEAENAPDQEASNV